LNDSGGQYCTPSQAVDIDVRSLRARIIGFRNEGLWQSSWFTVQCAVCTVSHLVGAIARLVPAL